MPKVSLYLDTSVVLSAYLPDSHTAKVLGFLAKQNALNLSLWTDIEVRSALGVLVRQIMLTREQAEKVLKRYLQDRQSGIYNMVEIKPQHLQAAFESFVFSLPLKSADALHLGIARYEGFRLITLDVKQAKSANHNKVSCKLL